MSLTLDPRDPLGDYRYRRATLAKIQQDPQTARDPQVRLAVMRRLAELNRAAQKQLSAEQLDSLGLDKGVTEGWKSSLIGGGTGALAGALMGGPIGAVAGLGVGAAVGNYLERETEKNVHQDFVKKLNYWITRLNQLYSGGLTLIQIELDDGNEYWDRYLAGIETEPEDEYRESKPRREPPSPARLALYRQFHNQYKVAVSKVENVRRKAGPYQERLSKLVEIVNRFEAVVKYLYKTSKEYEIPDFPEPEPFNEMKGVTEEASPMIKPPTNRFGTKREAFEYQKQHGGRVFRRRYTDPNTGRVSTTYVVKPEESAVQQDVAEGLSWKSLDAGLSLDNKIAIFEEYYTKGNLFESIDEDKKSYFVSLFDMSSAPEKNKRYIVVPLSLMGDRILPLDKPSYLEYLGKSNGQLVFRSNRGEIRYPSKTMRDLSVFNTFTFSSSDTYDKFRTALTLKFDTNLPDVILSKKGVAEGSRNKEQRAKELQDYIRLKQRVLDGGNRLSQEERRALSAARRELKQLKSNQQSIAQDVDVDAIHAQALREHLLTNPKLYENRQDVIEMREFLKLHATPAPRVGQEYAYASVQVTPLANFVHIAHFNNEHPLVKLGQDRAYFEIDQTIKKFPVSGSLSGDALSEIYFFNSAKEFQDFNTLLSLKYSDYKITHKVLDQSGVQEGTEDSPNLTERSVMPTDEYRVEVEDGQAHLVDGEGTVRVSMPVGTWRQMAGRRGRADEYRVEVEDGQVHLLDGEGTTRVSMPTSVWVGLKEGLRDPEDNPCWKGYHPVGTKKKNGRTVPNCVPNANESTGTTETKEITMEHDNPTPVAEGHADQQRKIFKKNGQPVGEVGIDRESSPGVGQWYMKCYANGIDNSGYDSYDEAVSELKHCLKQDVVEGSATTWEVCFDYGPHMSETVKVKASSEKEACAKVKKDAEKRGRNIMINWAKPVEQGLSEGYPNDGYGHRSLTVKQIKKMIETGNWEATTDIRPRHHLQLRNTRNGETKTVHVKAEVSKGVKEQGVAEGNHEETEETAVINMFEKLVKQGRDPIDLIAHRFGWGSYELDRLARNLGFKNSAEWARGVKQGKGVNTAGVAEGFTGRETKDGTWRVFKDGKAVAVAGPFKTREEASEWITKQKKGLAEGSDQRITVGSKVYHSLYGSGKVLRRSTGAGADHWAEVKFVSGDTRRVKVKQLKLEKEQGVSEGSNSSPFNQEQNLRSKNNKELDDLIQFWNRALEKNPEHKVPREHKVAREQLELIKMIRAERIGKKRVAEGADIEYVVVIRDEQGKRSIRVSALTPTDAKEKAEAQGHKVLKVKDPREANYFREQDMAEGSGMNVVKSIKVGNFRHDLVDTGMGWQVRIYIGDELYDAGFSKNSEQKGLEALEDSVAYTEKQINTKRQDVAEGTESSIKKKIQSKQDSLSLAREQRRAKGHHQQGKREIKLQAEIDRLSNELTQLKKQSVAEGSSSIRRIIGYRVPELDLFIPIRDWERFDGLYYQEKGYEFEPVWDDNQGVAEGYKQNTNEGNEMKRTQPQINEYRTLAGWQAAARRTGATLVSEGTRAVRDGILVGRWDGRGGQLMEGVIDTVKGLFGKGKDTAQPTTPPAKSGSVVNTKSGSVVDTMRRRTRDIDAAVDQATNEGVEDRLEAAREKAAKKGLIRDREEEKSPVRKVAGSAYGGSKAKEEPADDGDDDDTPPSGGKKTSASAEPRRRGRPPGSAKKAAPAATEPKRRGRPPKARAAEPAAPKKRGRPRKVMEGYDVENGIFLGEYEIDPESIQAEYLDPAGDEATIVAADYMDGTRLEDWELSALENEYPTLAYEFASEQRVPELDRMTEQSVREGGILKSIKRGLQGWDKKAVGPGGERLGDPRAVAARAKNLSDKDLKSVYGTVEDPKPHSPAGLQKRVVDREMKKRGLGEEGLAEGSVQERRLSSSEKSRKEEYVKGMKKSKGDFEKRYGERGEEVMHATATKMAKKKVAESRGAKPDYLDLDKDGDREEPMKQAAADAKKEKTDESIDQIRQLAGLGNTHRSGADMMKPYQIKEAAKPDYLDLDKDGDRKEPMKQAAADAKKEKKEKVDENINMNISADGEEDVSMMIRKLAGIPAVMVATSEPAPSTGCGLSDAMQEMTEEYDNAPDETVYDVNTQLNMGGDLNRAKTQHADRPKAGDNPLATHPTMESLLKKYQDILGASDETSK